MRAEIISCGTELLLGHITDTNATYLAQSLAAQGIDLFYVSQVGDNQHRLVETLQRAWQRSELIIMTGGIGPTEDDLTREGISELVGETMAVNPQLEADLRARFANASSPMLARNLKQAALIPSAQSLRNVMGSAPGWWVEKEGRIIVAMPGVPREMYHMWEHEALPRLATYTGGLIFTRLLRVYGMGESTVEEVLGDLIHNTNPTVATYAKIDAVDVRITAKAESTEQAKELVAAMEAKARAILGDHIFGIEGETLASVVGKYLHTRGQTLGIMESLTGGQLASTITDVPGSSSYFIGSAVTYTNELKAEMGVPRDILAQYGAISTETASAMAHAIRARFGTDFGIGITGVAGPAEQEGKSAGTIYIAIEGPQGTVTSGGPGWRAGRLDNKRYAVLSSLNLLRHYLEGSNLPEAVS